MRSLLIATLFLLIGCANPEVNDDVETSLTFGDLVELDKLEGVKMRNNSGTFQLTSDQIENIKKEMSSLVYQPGCSVKVGGINMELTINDKIYNISTATHGSFIEVHRDIVTKNANKIEAEEAWLYFKVEDVNFDNYKEL